MGKSNGVAGPNTSRSERNPQRIVLLAGDEHSEVKASWWSTQEPTWRRSM